MNKWLCNVNSLEIISSILGKRKRIKGMPIASVSFKLNAEATYGQYEFH